MGFARVESACWRWISAWLLCGALTSVGIPVFAAGEITVTINAGPQNSAHGDVFVVGHYGQFAATFSPPPTGGYAVSWQRRPVCSPSGSWYSEGASWTFPNISAHHSRVGQLEYKCSVGYADGRNGVASVIIDVKGPNHVNIQGTGQNSSGFPTMMCELQFQWEYEDGTVDIPIGSPVDTAAYVQERIVVSPPWRGLTVPFDSGWSPSPPPPVHPDYFFSSPDAIDRKKVTLTDPSSLAWWNGFAIGDPFDEFFQQNRIVMPTYCGGTHIVTGTGRTYQKIKSGSQTFSVVLLP